MNDILCKLINDLDLEHTEKKGSRGEHIVLTYLYNEEWLIKLILQWYASNSRELDERITKKITQSEKWFSEARIGSFFNDRHTHADGIIGDFSFDADYVSKVTIDINFKSVTILEAKLGSSFSANTTNSYDFDQITRYIGNIAYMLYERNIDSLDNKTINLTIMIPKELPKIKGESIYKYLYIDPNDWACDPKFKFKLEQFYGIKENSDPLSNSYSKIKKRLKESVDLNDLTKRNQIDKYTEYVERLESSNCFTVSYIYYEDVIGFMGNNYEHYYEKCKKYNGL